MTPTDIFNVITVYIKQNTVQSSIIGLTKYGILIVGVGDENKDMVVMGSWDDWIHAYPVIRHAHKSSDILFNYILLPKPLVEQRHQYKFRTKKGVWIQPASGIDDGFGGFNLVMNVRNPSKLLLERP
jgi:hypothetical protein